MIYELNDNTPTIETVERQFEQWRSIRAKKRKPIPQHLWQAAAQLCKTHPITHVCRRLQLSTIRRFEDADLWQTFQPGRDQLDTPAGRNPCRLDPGRIIPDVLP
jgi:hypothetical protein